MNTIEVVRQGDELHVNDGERIHVFKRPSLYSWVAFIDGAGNGRAGMAGITLCKATYRGEKTELNLLLRAQPALSMTLTGQFAEMLTEGIKIRKG